MRDARDDRAQRHVGLFAVSSDQPRRRQRLHQAEQAVGDHGEGGDRDEVQHEAADQQRQAAQPGPGVAGLRRQRVQPVGPAAQRAAWSAHSASRPRPNSSASFQEASSTRACVTGSRTTPEAQAATPGRSVSARAAATALSDSACSRCEAPREQAARRACWAAAARGVGRRRAGVGGRGGGARRRRARAERRPARAAASSARQLARRSSRSASISRCRSASGPAASGGAAAAAGAAAAGPGRERPTAPAVDRQRLGEAGRGEQQHSTGRRSRLIILRGEARRGHRGQPRSRGRRGGPHVAAQRGPAQDRAGTAAAPSLWTVMLALLGTHLAGMGAFLTVPVLAPPIAAETGLPASLAGVHTALVYAGALVSGPLAGPLVRRHGGMRVCRGGCWSSALGIALAALGASGGAGAVGLLAGSATGR